MSELTITNIVLPIVALMCLMVGLTFQLHKSHALFLFSGCAAISGVINPIFFMNNEDMYAYEGWSAIRVFDFTSVALVKSYEGFYFIFSAVVILSLTFVWGSGGTQKRGVYTSSALKMVERNDKHKNNYGLLLLFCTVLMAVYFPLYKHGIGITGVPGELPYHLSGAVHYIRAYLVPIVLAMLVYRASPSWRLVAILCLYTWIAGIAAASRFVAILPLVLATFYLGSLRKNWLAIVCILFGFFLWFSISASRDLTFDGDRHDLSTVLYYSLTNIHLENIVNELDLFSGRVSGSQQMVLASQLHGNAECGNIFGFIFGMSDVCGDTAGYVYGLDLSGTAYGVGLSLIPSIVISGDGVIDYVLPAILVVMLLSLSQFTYRRLVAQFNWQGIGILYLFLSVLFIYLGQMRFYYVLQFISIICLLFWPFLSRYLLHLRKFKIHRA